MWRSLGTWLRYPIIFAALMLVAMIPAGVAVQPKGAAASGVDAFRVRSFTGDYTVVRNDSGGADVHVEEAIVVDFQYPNTNHGILRALPTTYQGHRYEIDDVSVSGSVTTAAKSSFGGTQSGSPRFTTSWKGTVLILLIGDPHRYVTTDVSQRYLIRYTLRDVALNSPDGTKQEIYLDTNGTGWQQPFDRITANLHLPADLATATDGEAACYQGRSGSTDTCAISRTDEVITSQATGLGPGGNLTFAVGFKPGTFAQAYTPTVGGISQWWWTLVVPGLGLLLWLINWLRHRYYHRVGKPDVTVVRYTPPDVPIFVAADVLGKEPLTKAAMLLEMVSRGAGHISSFDSPTMTAPEGGRSLSWLQRRRLRKSLCVEADNLEVFNEADREYYADVFGTGSRQALDGQPEWNEEANAQDRATYVFRQGLRYSPPDTPGFFLGVFIVMVLVQGIGMVASQALGVEALVVITTGLVGVVLLVAAAYASPSKGSLTPDGIELRDHLLGLKEFVTMAEANRISFLQNAVDAPRLAGPDDSATLVKLYEPLLPYALLFGCEKTWLQVVGSHQADLPELGQNWLGVLQQAGLSLDEAFTTVTRSQRRRDYTSNLSGQRSFSDLHDSAAQARDEFSEGFAEMVEKLNSSSNDGGSSSSWSFSSGGGGGSSGGGRSGGGVGGGGGGGW